MTNKKNNLKKNISTYSGYHKLNMIKDFFND